MSNHILVPPCDTRVIYCQYSAFFQIDQVNSVALERTDGVFIQCSEGVFNIVVHFYSVA